MSKHGDETVAYLIGQLGKNSASSYSSEINLENILSEIYGVIEEAQHLVGGRLVILECENEESLISLYERQGFSRLEVKDSNNSLVTMYQVISNAPESQ